MRDKFANNMTRDLLTAPNVEVTVTEKTTSIKKEKVTVIGDQETRVVENSPTFTETLLPVTEVNEGSHVRYVHIVCEPSFISSPTAFVSLSTTDDCRDVVAHSSLFIGILWLHD